MATRTRPELQRLPIDYNRKRFARFNLGCADNIEV